MKIKKPWFNLLSFVCLSVCLNSVVPYFCIAACFSVPPVYWATSFKLFTLKMVTPVYVEAKHFGGMMVLNTKTGKLDNIYRT